MTIWPDEIAEIQGVCCEFTGRGNFKILEDCKSFCEDWLYSLEKQSLDATEIENMRNELEIGQSEAIATMLVERAETAWQNQAEHVPENMSVSPIL